MAVVTTTHWRDSARSAKLWIFDARAAFPFLLFLLHIKLWTFGLAVATTIFFSLLQRYGFTMPVFLRWVRSRLAGPMKLSKPWWV